MSGGAGALTADATKGARVGALSRGPSLLRDATGETRVAADSRMPSTYHMQFRGCAHGADAITYEFRQTSEAT
jgi:hypothetical protein